MPLNVKEQISASVPFFKSRTGGIVADMAMKLTGMDHFSEVYDRCERDKGPDFARNVLEDTGVDYLIGGYERLKELPEGPFITISNHPYGGVDGLILVDLFGHLRPDFKVLVNKILSYLRALDDNFITVTPTGTERTAPTADSLRGIKLALMQIREGHPLGIFPSGAVSDLSLKDRKIRDRPWQEPIIRVIKKAGVPVLPVRFFDHNFMFYYLLGLINWKVRLARLPREVINKRGRLTRVGIGDFISVEKQKEFSDIREFSDFLRSSVYDMPLPEAFVRRSEIKL